MLIQKSTGMVRRFFSLFLSLSFLRASDNIKAAMKKQIW